jgi:hypothetical protein
MRRAMLPLSIFAMLGPAALLLASASPVGACGPERLERSTVARLGAGGDIILADGRVLRLAGLHGVDPARLPLRPGDVTAHGALAEADRWRRIPSVVFALPEGGDPVFLQAWMAATGRALVRHEPTLGECWRLLQEAEAKAASRPAAAPEAGRYARIEGRVQRIGEGRTAHFITIEADAGTRITGLVQKRNLARITRNGVDLATLKGHIVRLRGVRSLRNPRVIAVTRAEQIEIVR